MLGEQLTVLYASQSGGAEEIAKNIHREAKQLGYIVQIYVADDFAARKSAVNTPLVIVCSTTGEGDVPDNGVLFYRYLQSLEMSSAAWKCVKYALLGLGDSSYPNFCGGPRKLIAELERLGSQCILESTFVDDDTGLEATVDLWLVTLWDALSEHIGQLENSAVIANVQTQLEQLDIGKELPISTAATHVDVKTESTNRLQSHPHLLRHEVHNVGYLHIPGIPELAEIHTVTGLPRSSVPAITTRFVGHTKVVDTSVTSFYRQFQSPITKSAIPPYTALNPLLAPLTKTCILTNAYATKKAISASISIREAQRDNKWQYVPGDAVGILAPNSHAEALALATLTTEWYSQGDNGEIYSQILEIQGLQGDKDLPMSLHGRKKTALDGVAGHFYSVYEVFRFLFSINSSPQKALFRALSDMTTNKVEKKTLLYLCSKEGSTVLIGLKKYQPRLLSIIVSFPSLKLDITQLISLLPPLTPRHYSITTSPLVSSHTLDVVFNVVSYILPEPLKTNVEGLCTTWLEGLTQATTPILSTENFDVLSAKNSETEFIPVFPHPTARFHMPHDATTPMILVGPGTGVAPFLSFLRHRQAQARLSQKLHPKHSLKQGEIWLFYGCRHAERDWLFKTEMEEFVSDGTLAQYIVSFSRMADHSDPALCSPRQYVQDKLKEHGDEVFRLLIQSNARLYVCGDAKAMAKDVLTTICDIVSTRNGEPAMKVQQMIISEWMTSGKYLQDLWV